MSGPRDTWVRLAAVTGGATAGPAAGGWGPLSGPAIGRRHGATGGAQSADRSLSLRWRLPWLFPILHRHQLLAGPIVEAATAVALTGEIAQPHPVAAAARAGHHTAFRIAFYVFNHTRKVTNSTASVNLTIVTKYDKTDP